jgi:transposase
MSGSFDRIVAIDLGKFKSVACLMQVADQSQAFETIEMSPKSMHDLIARHMTPDPAKTLVVIETCDTSGWVHDICIALGVQIIVVSAHGDAWRWSKVKRKTGRDDALKLARLALLGQHVSVHMPSPQERQKRRLILSRRSVVEMRTKCRNQIRSIFSQQGLALVKGNKQWTIAGMAQLRENARPLAECEVDDLWRGRLDIELKLIASIDEQLKAIDRRLDAMADDRMRLLQTLKGVGPRVSEAVVLHLHDPHRFKTADQVASYAGLVPKQYQSGEMIRFGHITHRGPALLRSVLVEAAWSVWRHNAWARAWVEKISRGSRARRKIAIVALARRILVMLWAMLRTNTPFRDPTHREPMTELMCTS